MKEITVSQLISLIVAIVGLLAMLIILFPTIATKIRDAINKKKDKGNKFNFLYIKENVNPYQNYTGDCAIRAIAKLLNMSWENAYRLLFNTALKRKSIATEAETIKLSLINSGCKLTYPLEPLKEYQQNTGESILVLINNSGGGHAIYIKDGAYYDTSPINPNEYKILFKADKEKNK